MNQKKIIVILVVLVIIFVGATIYFAMTKSATNQQSAVTADWKKYQNEKYGFELIFPDTWQGYNATSRILSWGDLGASDSIDFGLPAQKEGLFNISIHAKDQWEKIKKGEYSTPEYLGENDIYVFGWTPAQAAVEGDLEQRQEEVTNIIKTFKLVEAVWKDFSFNGNSFSFKYPSKFCYDNTDCRDLYAVKIGDMVSIVQTREANGTDSEYLDSILDFYYSNGSTTDQNGAEKYLKDKYELTGAISWTADKNNPKVKVADFTNTNSRSKLYATYSKELNTLVSFGLSTACLFDCQIDQKMLQSIKLDGVQVYHE